MKFGILLYRILISILFLSSYSHLNAQSEEGFWDERSATKREVTLCAGCKTWIRTEEIPLGTTALLYRITIPDGSQEMVESFNSLLSKVPTPSAQGAAAILSLASKFNSSSKSRFTIFTSYNTAENFRLNGVFQTGCYIHPEAVSAHSATLKLNSTCLNANSKYLWFGFTSTNIFDDQKIILEVVPWVNYKLSAGWNEQVTATLHKNCLEEVKHSPIEDKKIFCDCIVEKFVKSKTFFEVSNSGEQAIKSLYEKFSEECMLSTGEHEIQLGKKQVLLNALIQAEAYADAISILEGKVQNGTATAQDYYQLGTCYLYTKQFLQAVRFFKECEQKDPYNLSFKLSLAFAHLLNGDEEIAHPIFAKYKHQNIDANLSWSAAVNDKLNHLMSQGVPISNPESVLANLK